MNLTLPLPLALALALAWRHTCATPFCSCACHFLPFTPFLPRACPAPLPSCHVPLATRRSPPTCRPPHRRCAAGHGAHRCQSCRQSGRANRPRPRLAPSGTTSICTGPTSTTSSCVNGQPTPNRIANPNPNANPNPKPPHLPPTRTRNGIMRLIPIELRSQFALEDLPTADRML